MPRDKLLINFGTHNRLITYVFPQHNCKGVHDLLNLPISFFGIPLGQLQYFQLCITFVPKKWRQPPINKMLDQNIHAVHAVIKTKSLHISSISFPYFISINVLNITIFVIIACVGNSIGPTILFTFV